MTRTDDTMTSRLDGGPGKVNLHLNTWQVFFKKPALGNILGTNVLIT